MYDESLIRWFGYWCSYCQIYTWMAQLLDSEAGMVNCRRCAYPSERKGACYDHEQFTSIVLDAMGDRSM